MSSDFTPTQAEAALTSKIFESVDPNKLGIITGDVAVNVFSGSKLSAGTLGEIWAISDKENNGFLTRKGVTIALRLIGHAQRGESVSESLLSKVGLPPTIDGYTLPILQQNTGSSASRAKSPTPSALPLPTLTPQDKTKYMKIFLSCNPVNGMLSGDKASEVFVKSKLPVDKLSQIWNLADTQKRGSLDSADFSIAMYLIQACMSGQLSFVPTSLPPGLYEMASSKSLDGVAAHSTGGSSHASPGVAGSFASRTVQPQYTGSQPLQAQITGSLARLATGPPTLPSRPSVQSTTNAFIQPRPTGEAPQWDVTPAEKANADKLFAQLDSSKRGFIEGDVAVPFMLQSKLPEDVLAQIWDLADLQNDGRLTRDGFAVAMHLIQKKLSGKDIPVSLPPSLIPLSMRANHMTPPAPQQHPQESIQDLLWDDTPLPSATSPPPQTLQPQRTGPLQTQPQILQPQRTGPLSAQVTGVRLSESALQHLSPPKQGSFGGSLLSGTRDLLGDDEDTAPPPFHDRSAEIGNAQNQLSSTSRALETVKTERADIEQTLGDQAAQLSTLQTQLASAKTAYEAETGLLETLRDKYATQNVEIKKLREELITAESDVSALRAEKNEVQGNLMRDKEEVRELQKKMALAGAEIETLKVEIEKAKKDAKQQKGLLAIAKKQLATRETEKAKAESELQDVQIELKDATKEREEAEAELTEVPSNLTNGHSFARQSSLDTLSMAISQPLPATPDPIPSPPVSGRTPSGKSTNPFDRLGYSGTPRSGSPFLPFASSSDVPQSQPDIPGPSTDNPFGFSTTSTQNEEPQTFISETPTNGIEDAAAATPKPGFAMNVISGTDVQSRTEPEVTPASDTEDLFSTPPSTAAGRTSPNSPALDLSSSLTSSYIALDAAAAHFPELTPHLPGHFPDIQSTEETNLNSAVKELEVDDSDSSDEGAEEPVVQEHATQPVPSETASILPATSAFDDTFGFSSEPPQSGAPAFPSTYEQISVKHKNQATYVPFEPSSTDVASPSIETVLGPNEASSKAPTGKNAFDEAMGIISTDQTAATNDFSFDSAFDDNFDFAAAKAQAEQPFFPPAKSNTANGTVTSASAAPQNERFDSIFGIEETSTSTSPPATIATNKSLSFDDAFGSESSNTRSLSLGPNIQDSLGISFDNSLGRQQLSKVLAFDDAFSAPKAPPVQPTPSVTFSASPPGSPTGPSSPFNTSNMRQSTSPSPDLPPRQTSPRTRSSTGSSDKLKEPPTKHSRLSIRLPFGRKKKQDNPPPVPRQSQLSPAAEDTIADDDDTVKQLTAMGFSRDDAVSALERNSYDFQRALNNLLGA